MPSRASARQRPGGTGAMPRRLGAFSADDPSLLLPAQAN
jgi:hypothetical protein